MVSCILDEPVEAGVNFPYVRCYVGTERALQHFDVGGRCTSPKLTSTFEQFSMDFVWCQHLLEPQKRVDDVQSKNVYEGVRCFWSCRSYQRFINFEC